MQNAFGAGSVYGVDTNSANPTPVQISALQEGSLDFSSSTKELYGSQAFPIAVAGGTRKINWKAKMGAFNARLFNNYFFNGTLATGQTSLLENVSVAVATTVTAANITGFKDLGVYEIATNKTFTRVASGPTTGTYSVNEGTGVYTFAAADVGKIVAYSYQYTIAATGQSITITNPQLGTSTPFKMVFSALFNNLRNTWILNACTATKLGVGTKTEDFVMPEMEGGAFADSAGNIGIASFAEQN